MPTMERKSLNQPEETNTPEKLKMGGCYPQGLTLRRVTTEPGWQWSKHLKPVQKTNSLSKGPYAVCHLGQTRGSYG